MAPIPHYILTPQIIPYNPLDTMEIDGHKPLLRQTIYHVNKWHIEHLTARQLCKHINTGLTPEHLK